MDVLGGRLALEGVDYIDIFAPIVKFNIIRSILGVVIIEDLYLEK